MSSSCPFSIIVPTCGRPLALRRLIDSLQQQQSPPAYELIVVQDDTSPLAAAGETSITDVEVRILSTGGPLGPATARNIGAKQAQGETLIFIDDDVWLDPHALARLGARHAQASIPMALSALLLPDPDLADNIYMHFAYGGAAHRAAESKVRSTSYEHYCTAFCSIDQALFKAAGGFNTELRYFEDSEMAYRLVEAGGSLRMPDDIIGYHLKKMDRDWFIERCSQLGRHLYRYHKRCPAARKPHHRLYPLLQPLVAATTGPRKLAHTAPPSDTPASYTQNLALSLLHTLSIIRRYRQEPPRVAD